MQLSFTTPIWLYPAVTDFRKQLDSLIILIADVLEKDPCSGELFIFRNRSANKVKLVWYETNGFWLCYKRLCKGRLQFPSIHDTVMEISRDQLSWLLSGLDMQKQKAQAAYRATHFY